MAHDFAVLGSQVLYDGAILRLRLDEVAMPGGGSARREVVEHFGAVAILAAEPAEDGTDRITLIHQYRHPVARRLWEIPAGLLDVPGEDPLDAARRELAEEVGLAAERWSVLVDVDSSPGFTDESVRVFLAEQLRRAERPTPRDEEADLTVRTVPLDEAVAMALHGELVNGTAVAAVLALAAAREHGITLRTPDAEWVDRPSRFVR